VQQSDVFPARECRIPIGTRVGLYGDDAPPIWCHGEIVYGTLIAYMIVEARHPFFKNHPAWDFAALVRLEKRLDTVVGNSTFIGQQLLSIQRYPQEIAWDFEQVVHVYGVSEEMKPNASFLSLAQWHPKAVWLASHATLFVDSQENLSELVMALRRRQQRVQSNHDE
jgi:hypothetical protein